MMAAWFGGCRRYRFLMSETWRPDFWTVLKRLWVTDTGGQTKSK